MLASCPGSLPSPWRSLLQIVTELGMRLFQSSGSIYFRRGILLWTCWLDIYWWRREPRHLVHMSPPALQHPGISHMQLVAPTEKRTWKQLCLPQYLFAWDLRLFQSCFPASQKLFTLAQKEQLSQKNIAKCADLCCSNRFPKFMLVTDSRPSLLPWKMTVFTMVSDWQEWWAYPGSPDNISLSDNPADWNLPVVLKKS